MSNFLNIVSFLNFLNRNKTYTAINIFGLSVSLMFVILIACYTKQELSIDRFQEKADRIYVLGSEKGFPSADRLPYRVKDRFPEVEKVCPLIFHEQDVIMIGDDNWNVNLMFADTTFFDFFSFDLAQGDRLRVLEAKNNAVISESFARKVFGNEDPLGKTIRLKESMAVTVSAVMKDIRYSVIPYCDMLVRIDNAGEYAPGWSYNSEGFENVGSAVVFLMEKEGTDLRAREADMLTYFKEIFWIYNRGLLEEVRLTPLADVYFSQVGWSMFLKQGDRQFVLILLSVGLLILLFAVINYINLTVAQTGFRAKEMATRRLLGSSRKMLFGRLIMESMLLSFLSLGFGLFLAYLCVPFAEALLATKLSLTDAITPLSVLCVLVVTVLVGFLSGLLPAIVISNAKPIEVVRGSFRKKVKMVFSKVFITFQQAITIGMVAASLVMIWQIRHLIHAPLGYNTTNVIDIPVMRLDKQLQLTLGNELKQLSGVKRLAFSEGTPFSQGNNYTFEYEDRMISLQRLRCERELFDILGVQILRDNHLATGDDYYLTQYAMKEFNVPDDVQSVKVGENVTPVAGIVKDIQMANILSGPNAISFIVRKVEDFHPWDIMVEVQGNPYTAFNEVKKTYERVTQLEFEGMFVDQQIEKTFAPQQRLAKLVIVFGAIAILISLLGLLAMSTYFIQQRYREIGVRKVFGSTNREVLSRLVNTFLRYVLVGFVIATPIVWYIMNGWLSGYSYRIPLSPLVFIAAGAFCFLISFFTVYWQSYMAATENPANSIKSE